MRLFSMVFDEGECSFKFKRCLFEYKSRKFMLYPGDERYYMTVDTIIRDKDDKERAFQDIHEFLYLFGWKNNFVFQFLDAGSMSPADEKLLLERTVPFMRIPRKMYSYTELIWHVSERCSSDVKLMMSLYNDAISSSNVFFRFLNLYKVLDFHFKSNNNRIKNWIESQTNLIIEDIGKMEYYKPDVNGKLGSYLRTCLRNAIAHSYLKNTTADKNGLVAYKHNDFVKTAEAAYILEKLVYHLINSLVINDDSQVVHVLLEEKN